LCAQLTRDLLAIAKFLWYLWPIISGVLHLAGVGVTGLRKKCTLSFFGKPIKDKVSLARERPIMVSIGGGCFCLSDLCFDFAAGCTVSWVKTLNMLYQDGHAERYANSVDDCRAACVDTPKCTGIDYHWYSAQVRFFFSCSLN